MQIIARKVVCFCVYLLWRMMTSPRVTTDVDVSAELMASGLTFSNLATD
jgi:hypothetical protein